MKPEFRLQNIIKEGLNDTFLIWKSELKNVFADTGVMIFFFWFPSFIRCCTLLFTIMNWYVKPRWWW